MTTIAYTKNILAADSRCTHSVDSGEGDFVCTSCGDETKTVTEDSNKILLGSTKATFRNQKVLALGGAGVTAAIERAIKVIQTGGDLEESMKHYRALANTKDLPCAVLIVCEKNVFEFNGRVKYPMVKEFSRDAQVIIGSGEDAARTVIELTQCDAVSAVHIATAIDQYSGGAVSYVEFDKGPLEIKKSEKSVAVQTLKNFRERFVSAKPTTVAKSVKATTMPVVVRRKRST